MTVARQNLDPTGLGRVCDAQGLGYVRDGIMFGLPGSESRIGAAFRVPFALRVAIHDERSSLTPADRC